MTTNEVLNSAKLQLAVTVWNSRVGVGAITPAQFKFAYPNEAATIAEAYHAVADAELSAGANLREVRREVGRKLWLSTVERGLTSPQEFLQQYPREANAMFDLSEAETKPTTVTVNLANPDPAAARVIAQKRHFEALMQKRDAELQESEQAAASKPKADPSPAITIKTSLRESVSDGEDEQVEEATGATAAPRDYTNERLQQELERVKSDVRKALTTWANEYHGEQQ